eukprot:TRINITY_DN55936_c0_g1_i1.p2 TRINITY_DN55936_c0_g1~~TRINITY_DN55936_c0_g1_i1.p2  ORF type:complete len:321 (+),score=91.84 TRINITY_DN55936_c0_g1_i1:79-1041(+)
MTEEQQKKEPPRQAVLIFLRLPDGETIPAEVPADGSVGELRAALVAACGEQVAGGALLWEGVALEDATLLADAGVGAQAVVTVSAGALSAEAAAWARQWKEDGEAAAAAWQAELAVLSPELRAASEAAAYMLGGARVEAVETIDADSWAALWTCDVLAADKAWREQMVPFITKAKDRLAEVMLPVVPAPVPGQRYHLTVEQSHPIKRVLLASMRALYPQHVAYVLRGLSRLRRSCWTQSRARVSGPEALTVEHLKVLERRMQARKEFVAHFLDMVERRTDDKSWDGESYDAFIKELMRIADQSEIEAYAFLCHDVVLKLV